MALIHVTKESFDADVAKASGKVLLDFWAPWCGPCRMVGPIVEELAQENEAITVGKVNVDEELALATAFGITSIPTLVVMEGGKVVAQAVGYRPKEDILRLLEG